MSSRCTIICLILAVTLSNSNCFRTKNNDPYVQIVSDGLSAILWSEDDTFSEDVTNLTSNCASSLEYIYNGIHDTGSPDAYKLLDFSSKISPGILQGTTASIGKYDCCLSLQLDGYHGRGQYCTVTMALKDPGNSSAVGSLYYKALPYLGAFDLSFGLCLPSTCSRDEVETFVLARTARYPLKLSTHKKFPFDLDTPVTCETYEETTWLYRLKNLSKAQMVSILWIALLLSIVPIASFLTFVGLRGRINDFSVQRTLQHLSSYEEPIDMAVFIMDSVKTMLVTGAVAIHASLPIERGQTLQFIETPNIHTPLLGESFSHPWSGGGLGAIPFFAGYSCYKFYSSRISSPSFSYIGTILKRYSRMSLLVSTAIAAEFIFPLLTQGPIHKSTTERMANDCHDSWWEYFILSTPSPTRSCAIHMFHAPIDVKLFIIGLLILVLMKRFGEKAALVTCGLISLISCTLVHERVKHLNVSSLIRDPQLILERIYASHFTFFYHLPAFIVGLVTAYIVENKMLLYTPTKVNRSLHLLLFTICSVVIWVAPDPQRMADILPQTTHSLLIVGHRVACLMTLCIFFLLLSHSHWLSMKHVPNFLKKFFVHYHKIIPAIHLTSILIIRYHFLITKKLNSARGYDVLSRWLFLNFIINVYIAPTVHILLVAPLTALFPRSKSPVHHSKDE